LAALQKRWEVLPPPPAEHLARFPDLPTLIVQLLYNRQIRTRDEVAAFLSRTVAQDNPFRLKGMNAAVTRLRQAIRNAEAVAIYGDYDVDGVTATALLVLTLRALGSAHVVPYIPNRLDEGYGLNKPALTQLAEQGVRVVVTVDCGVRSVDEVVHAGRLGLDLIITDHHALGAELPPALAVIDARREDDAYPFKHLAGVGLAFKLAQALLRAEQQVPASETAALPQEEDLLDLVALGTVADLAPLIGENRALVSRGIEKLNEARRPGIAAMLSEAGLEPGQVDAGKIGFVLGPRLNAAGRLDDAIASYRLLTTPSLDKASELAQQLGEQNRLRQQLLNEMVQRAREEVEAQGDAPLYVLASSKYLPGIAGLVASRVTEEFHRPTLVIALDDVESRGSARSIQAFHITRALDKCHELLVHHGGHAAAAGFTIRNEHVDALRERLSDIARQELNEEDLVPRVKIDMALAINGASWEHLALIEDLHPFGIGNPRPTFVAYDVQVRHSRPIGKDGASLMMKLSDGVAVWDAFAFRQSIRPEQVGERIDVVYTMESDVWNGQRRMRLVVKDMRPAEGAALLANG
jgi:single-stranded-DNA-specific exonuclease